MKGQTDSCWVRRVLLTWGPCGSWSSWRSNLPPPTSAQSAPEPDGTPGPETEPTVWRSAAPRRPQWRGRTESSLDLGRQQRGDTHLNTVRKWHHQKAQEVMCETCLWWFIYLSLPLKPSQVGMWYLEFGVTMWRSWNFLTLAHPSGGIRYIHQFFCRVSFQDVCRMLCSVKVHLWLHFVFNSIGKNGTKKQNKKYWYLFVKSQRSQP